MSFVEVQPVRGHIWKSNDGFRACYFCQENGQSKRDAGDASVYAKPVLTETFEREQICFAIIDSFRLKKKKKRKNKRWAPNSNFLVKLTWDFIWFHFLTATFLSPVNLSDLLRLYSPSRSLRSSADIRFLKLPVCRCKAIGIVVLSGILLLLCGSDCSFSLEMLQLSIFSSSQLWKRISSKSKESD